MRTGIHVVIPGSAMKLLVSAGNTQTPIDRVRCITNIFTGRTGASIALRAHERGHLVTLLTSHPEAVVTPPQERWTLSVYRTFDDLQSRMSDLVRTGGFDAIVHCAAVSDYVWPQAVYAPAVGTAFTADGSGQAKGRAARIARPFARAK